MSNATVDDFLWLLSRARGTVLANRLLIGICPIMATASTALAVGRPSWIASAAIVGLGAACVVLPDSHLGLLVILALAVEWVVRVDNELSAWSMATAAFIGLFHVALAFAGVAPAGAHLPRPDGRRWMLRSIRAIGPIPVTWSAVVALDRVDLGPQTLVVTASLVLLAVFGSWSTSPDGFRPTGE